MNSQLPLVAIAVAFLGLSPASHADIKIEEQVVGPAPEQLPRYTVSPKGVSFAMLVMKGSRSVMVVDGVESPLFDELLNRRGGGSVTAHESLIFSPDGKRHAYFVRTGNDYILYVDGKELYRGTRTLTNLTNGELTFSPDGQHVYFTEMVRVNQSSNSGYRIVMDGVPGPLASHSLIEPVFSADGRRWAYVAGKYGAQNQEHFLMVDGKEAKFAGFHLKFSADNRLFSQMADKDYNQLVMIDGEAALKLGAINGGIWLPPTGSSWAVAGTQKGGTKALYLNGKVVSGSMDPAHVTFSPNGKRYMAYCRTQSGAGFVITDGKASLEYRGISEEYMKFTPDSSKAIFIASSGTASFVVVEGVESSGFQYLGGQWNQFPMVGSRFAYSTYDGSNRNFTLVLDGQQVPIGTWWPNHGSIAFSDDGSRYAYLAGEVGRNDVKRIILDGKELEGVYPIGIGSIEPGQPWTQFFKLSAGGKHIVYAAAQYTDNKKGLYVDDTMIYPSQRGIYYAYFTPDAKHLVWAGNEMTADTNRPIHQLYVDGEPAVTFTNQDAIKYPGSWEMGEDGAFRFLVIKGTNTVCYTVRPDPANDIATYKAGTAEREARMIAEAKAAEEAAKAKAAADAAAAAEQRKAEQDAKVAAYQKQREEALAARQKAYDEAVAAKKKAYEEAVAARKKKLEEAAAARVKGR